LRVPRLLNPPCSPYTPLFRSVAAGVGERRDAVALEEGERRSRREGASRNGDVERVGRAAAVGEHVHEVGGRAGHRGGKALAGELDRKSTRLNSSHEWISYAVF